MADITRIGREQLAVHGAAALSVRAVARELGIVSSAIYRYVKSRDDLLTLLLVDAYDELGDAVDAAVAEIPTEQFRARLDAIGRAVRQWARAEPASYALLFGGPVPGYQAPSEQTTPPGLRVPAALSRVTADAYAAGALRRTAPPTMTPGLQAGFDAMRQEFADVPEDLSARALFGWAALFGCVSWEIFGQYGPDGLGDPDALFESQLTLLAEAIGLMA
jgi:AcrR family transcriptional regulator